MKYLSYLELFVAAGADCGEEEGGEDGGGCDPEPGPEFGVGAEGHFGMIAELVPGGDDEDGVVERVGQNGHPDASGPEQQVAEVGSEEHAWNEPEKLHVECAEHKCHRPYGHMAVDAAGGEQALEGATEEQLLGKTGSHAHDEDIEDEAHYRRVGEHEQHGVVGAVFCGTCFTGEGLQGFGEGDIVVPVDDAFLQWNRCNKYTHNHKNGRKLDSAVEAHKLGRLAGDDHTCGDRREDESKYILEHCADAHGGHGLFGQEHRCKIDQHESEAKTEEKHACKQEQSLSAG